MQYIKADDRLGLVNENNEGIRMKIVKVLPDDRLIIQFQDDNEFEKEIHWVNFKSGNVKNPFNITMYGVGYIGDGIYKTNDEKGNRTKEYTSWKNLLRRCYSEEDKQKYPAYYGICTVCKEWFNFQNYASWYNNNFYDIGSGRMHLDKDVLFKNNKLYSPETCLFLPQRINMIFLEQPNKYNLPSAISLTASGKYHADYNTKRLGNFNTLEEAIKAHEIEKRIHIKQVAEEYKLLLPPKVYNALLAW